MVGRGHTCTATPCGGRSHADGPRGARGRPWGQVEQFDAEGGGGGHRPRRPTQPDRRRRLQWGCAHPCGSPRSAPVAECCSCCHPRFAACASYPLAGADARHDASGLPGTPRCRGPVPPRRPGSRRWRPGRRGVPRCGVASGYRAVLIHSESQGIPHHACQLDQPFSVSFLRWSAPLVGRGPTCTDTPCGGRSHADRPRGARGRHREPGESRVPLSVTPATLAP